MEQISNAFRYLKYALKAKDEHSLHSPFLFELYENAIKQSASFYKFKNIEQVRLQMLSSKETIEVLDLGAGSRVSKSNQRKVSDIAEHAVKPAKYGQLLFRLVNYFKPQTIIELGTSLGITTSYLASVNSNSKIFTFEGSPEIAKIARSNFKALGLENIELLEGNFDETFPVKLRDINEVDLAFVDGNHQKEPTLKYFEQLLAKSHNDTVLVFDDIHWSGGMEEAWNEIKADERVTVTLDFFYLGLVFLRKEQVKQDFVLKF